MPWLSAVWASYFGSTSCGLVGILQQFHSAVLQSCLKINNETVNKKCNNRCDLRGVAQGDISRAKGP